MPRAESDQLVSQSLLDRLTNLEPNLAADPPMTRAQSIRLLKQALRRDLEWLFNSRANADCPPPDVMPEVWNSVYNYGLPDFSNMSMANIHHRISLVKYMERAIAVFEPRLAAVQVRMSDQSYEAGKVIRFQIDGLLKMDPAPEQICFDTVLDVPSGSYEVKGETSAG